MGGPDRLDHPGPPFFGRRHPGPYFNQPDYRIYEDDATLTLTFCLEDGPKRYTIGRTLIPRYFRSIFEGGVTDLRYELRHPKESFHNTSITMDCDQCVVATLHGKPMFTK